MKTPLGLLLLTLATIGGVAHAQGGKDPWIGKRVFTQFGTVLKVGDTVVDDEGRTTSVATSGKDRNVSRVYRVDRVNGEWLWLKDEGSGVAGWVQSKYVVPYEQAIDFYTNRIRSRPSASAYNSRGLVWQEKGEYDIAIADYNEAIRLEPSESIYFNNRGDARRDKGDYKKAIADFDEAIRLDQKCSFPYNNRAWLWATCPEDKYRNGKKAVESATRACELGFWKDSGDLDTLAASYAEDGQFDKAVEWQEKAIKLLPNGPPADWQKRLDLYRDKKPYRDAP